MGSCYNGANNAIKSCNFSSTGLSSFIKSKIEEVTWYLGGVNASSFSDQVYVMERGNDTIDNPNDGVNRTTMHTGKVGLMYTSDYGYAADLRECLNLKLSAYSSTVNSYACSASDWLFTEKRQHTINPSLSYNYIQLRISASGYASGGNGSYDSYTTRPVFYLKSNVIFDSCNGTESDPYLIL